MKFADHIDRAFARLGFTPRPGQASAVSQILVEFVDRSAKNVVLSAPTGTGKSIIGAVTAEALSTILGLSERAAKSSISLVSTNALAQQYDQTFARLCGSDQYVMLKGAANYGCSALTTAQEVVSADSCAWWDLSRAGAEFSSTLSQHCDHCEFRQARLKKNTARHLTTNYSYFFIDRLYTGKFENRDLIIWDEAHLINDLFSEHNAVVLSQSRLQSAAKEFAEAIKLVDLEISRLLSTITLAVTGGKITADNYRTYLNSLFKVYTWARDAGEAAATRAVKSGRMNEYTRLSKFVKKYEGLRCKIDDLFNYNYPHVFDHCSETHTITIKPIFVGNMTKALECGQRNLFMSATIDADFMVTTLELDPAVTRFIKLEPTIPRENKQVIFFDPQALSWSSLQQPAVVQRLKKNTARIIKKHTSAGERGIVLSPSFRLQEEIVKDLQRAAAPGTRLFIQNKGENLQTVLDEFRRWSGGPAVLISPSIYEGIDLPHDLSRFQIIVKAPFPSLADRRFKHILDNYNHIYTALATMKLVQGAGRSVRSHDDHAVTYILDANAQRLFTAAANIWKNEFDVKFTNFL